MFRILVTILIVIISFAKNIPEFLAKGISEETAAFTRIPPQGWEKVGYTGITKKLIDAVIDDSGNVHIVIDEYYRDRKHIWSYLQYDKNGNKLFKKEIYSANYITISHGLLVSRLMVNPDMTILVIYPDSEFYTCWVKLDKEGNIIERNKPRWWRDDAGFRVCSAGQDSFHIISFPVGFSGQLIKQYDSMIGEYYLRVEPVIIPELFYSNNFALKNQRVNIGAPYKNLGVPTMIQLPDKRIFCCYNEQHYGYSWIMDSEGKCYDGEKFDKEKLNEACFAKVTIDTALTQSGIQIFHRPANISLFPDSTIGVGIFTCGTIYLLKYDLNGKIIQKGKGIGKLVRIDEMDNARVSPFVTQMAKTIFYWGFDDLGNFFLQIY